MASVGALAERAGTGRGGLGVAGQTALQAVHGSVQQLHPDAPRLEERAGRGGAAFSSSWWRRSHFLPPSLPVRDIHPHVSGRALCQRDTTGGKRVQVSDGVTVTAHTESRVQVHPVVYKPSTSVLLSHSAEYCEDVLICVHSCTGSLPHHFGTGGERKDSGAVESTASDGGRRKEWWESASNKLYTITTDKTISKLMMEYKRRKQQQQPTAQSHINLFMKEQGRVVVEVAGGREQRTPVDPQRPPQRPQHLLDQQGPPLRHSVSAGPEVLRQEKRPRSGSTISSHSISLKDSEAQIQVRKDRARS